MRSLLVPLSLIVALTGCTVADGSDHDHSAIAALQGSVDALATDLDAAEQTIVEQAAAIAAMEAELDALAGGVDLTELAADVDDHETRLAVLEADPITRTESEEGDTAISGTVAEHATWIATHTQDIAANTAAIDANVASIATNAASIATNAGDIATNSAGIATNGAAVTINATDIATNAAATATNTAGLATAAADIATNTTAIATNTADIATNTTAITTNTADIATNTTAVTTNTADIATNAGDIATNAGGIGTNATAVATNASGIATNAGGIATNASGIATNAGDIATNASGVSTNASGVSTNASGVSTNAADIATNAAAIAAVNEVELAGTVHNPATSCDDLLTAVPGLPDGKYWLIGASGLPYEAYCDMSTDTGGWTLLGTIFGGDRNMWNVQSRIWANEIPFGSADSPFSDHKSGAWYDLDLAGAEILLERRHDGDVMAQTVIGNPCLTDGTTGTVASTFSDLFVDWNDFQTPCDNANLTVITPAGDTRGIATGYQEGVDSAALGGAGTNGFCWNGGDTASNTFQGHIGWNQSAYTTCYAAGHLGYIGVFADGSTQYDSIDIDDTNWLNGSDTLGTGISLYAR